MACAVQRLCPGLACLQSQRDHLDSHRHGNNPYHAARLGECGWEGLDRELQRRPIHRLLSCDADHWVFCDQPYHVGACDGDSGRGIHEISYSSLQLFSNHCDSQLFVEDNQARHDDSIRRNHDAVLREHAAWCPSIFRLAVLGSLCSRALRKYLGSVDDVIHCPIYYRGDCSVRALLRSATVSFGLPVPNHHDADLGAKDRSHLAFLLHDWPSYRISCRTDARRKCTSFYRWAIGLDCNFCCSWPIYVEVWSETIHGSRNVTFGAY